MNPSAPITDEQLMAYADGELAGEERDVVADAVAADPALSARLAQQQEMRDRLRDAFADELDEPVPERLRQAVSDLPARHGHVVSLAEHRAAPHAPAPAPAREAANWARWSGWGGLAASVAFGVLIGHVAWPGGAGAPDGFALQEGRLIAQGDVKKALSTQTASRADAAAPVQTRLSFVDRDGRYCRTFSGHGTAGLACRDGDDWTVPLLVDAPASANATGLRQAGSALPAALLAEVDRRIDGSPLDAAAEQRALQRGWRR
jgi:negative regulator of sigma E activity